MMSTSARERSSADGCRAPSDLLNPESLAWSILDALLAAAVVVVDPDLRIIAAAGDAPADRGLTAGRRLRDVLPAAAFDRHAPHYARALAGESSILEAEITDEGSVHVTEFSPLRSAGAIVVGALAVSRDVTAARDENEELRRQWEQTFARTTRGISVANPVTGVIQSVNPAFAAMHGGSVGDFIGKQARSLVSAEWQSKVPGLVERVDREGYISIEHDHVRLDGTTFPVAAEAITTRDAGGALSYRISWLEDLTERRAVEQAHREASEMFEAAFADAPNGVALIGLDTRFLRVNAALCEMLGRTDAELIGTLTTDYCHPDDLAATHAAYTNMSLAAEPVSIVKRYVRSDGAITWASCRGIVVRGQGDEARYIVTHFQNITAQKLAEERQAEANQRFETAFDDAPIGMALVALDGRWLKVNRTLCGLTGYAEHQLLEKTFQQLTHADDLDADVSLVEQLLAGEIDRYTMEKRYITAGDHLIWANLAVSLVRNAAGQPLHFISQIEDISERKRLEASLQRLADHDSLTELWNRRRFEDELQRQVGRCQRYGEHAALLLLDLDGFKAVNDTRGHKVGDALLKRIAAGLRTRLRDTDSVARLGGDEFAVILANVSPDQATQLAATLGEVVVASRVPVDGLEIGVSASVGIAYMGERTVSPQEALEQADLAMYRAKPVAGRAAREPIIQGSATLT